MKFIRVIDVEYDRNTPCLINVANIVEIRVNEEHCIIYTVPLEATTRKNIIKVNMSEEELLGLINEKK